MLRAIGGDDILFWEDLYDGLPALAGADLHPRVRPGRGRAAGEHDRGESAPTSRKAQDLVWGVVIQ